MLINGKVLLNQIFNPFRFSNTYFSTQIHDKFFFLLPESIQWDGNMKYISPLILGEDKNLIAFYKPPSIFSQPDKDRKSLDLFTSCKDYLNSKYTKLDPIKKLNSDPNYLEIINRIDTPSSGVILYSKNSELTSELNELFRTRKGIKKKYFCMVNGKIEKEGFLRDEILKSNSSKVHIYKEQNPEKINSRRKKPKTVLAELSYKPLHVIQRNTESKSEYQTLLEIDLITGRKHQIRAQLSNLGFPICGDIKYGACQRFRSKEIALHSYYLRINPEAESKV